MEQVTLDVGYDVAVYYVTLCSPTLWFECIFLSSAGQYANAGQSILGKDNTDKANKERKKPVYRTKSVYVSTSYSLSLSKASRRIHLGEAQR